ncbi:hypothetical protein EDD15DRAFT_2199189 [Pisolithus albus]|nr:hypothetical protein EDD15DRAFT_2199189 [Pisolithus albus]
MTLRYQQWIAFCWCTQVHGSVRFRTFAGARIRCGQVFWLRGAIVTGSMEPPYTKVVCIPTPNRKGQPTPRRVDGWDWGGVVVPSSAKHHFYPLIVPGLPQNFANISPKKGDIARISGGNLYAEAVRGQSVQISRSVQTCTDLDRGLGSGVGVTAADVVSSSKRSYLGMVWVSSKWLGEHHECQGLLNSLPGNMGVLGGYLGDVAHCLDLHYIQGAR